MAVAQSVLERWSSCRVPSVPLHYVICPLSDFAAASVVDVYRVWTSRPSNSGDDLSQVLHVAASVVLCDVLDDKHAMRNLREATGARARGHLQNSMAHGEPDSPQTDVAG